jgi:hypothetical protein
MLTRTQKTPKQAKLPSLGPHALVELSLTKCRFWVNKSTWACFAMQAAPCGLALEAQTPAETNSNQRVGSIWMSSWAGEQFGQHHD